MTPKEFNEMIKTQKFVDFEFKFMPLSEVKNGQFFFFNGQFFQASGSAETPLRIGVKVGLHLVDDTKVIPNSYKVSAVINY